MPGMPANDRRAGAAGPGLLRLSPRCRSYGPNELRGPRPPPARGAWRTRTRVKRWYSVLRGGREDGSGIEGLTRPQGGGREVGVVGRVREVRGVEGVRVARPVAAGAAP